MDTIGASVDELAGMAINVCSDAGVGCSTGCCVGVSERTRYGCSGFTDPGLPHPWPPRIGVQAGSWPGTQSVMGGEVVSSL